MAPPADNNATSSLARRDRRALIEPASATRRGPLDALDVLTRMHEQDIVFGGRHRRGHGQSRPQVGGAQVRDHPGDTIGALDVVAGVVLGVDLVPDDGRVHSA